MKFSKIKTFVLAGGFALGALTGFGILAAHGGTNAPARLTPGPNDGRITYFTAALMENNHYSRRPLDDELSARFFDGYLEALDPRRENFLQSDIDGFMHYRTNLDRLFNNTSRTADLTPAFEIYQRYVERLQQHNDYVTGLLKEDKFKFTANDHILVDRRKAAYPKDLDEAKDMWRQSLRWQYLQEKLSRELSSTNSSVILPLNKTNYTEIADALARHYRWNFHYYTNYDSTDVLQLYLDALTHAYDPHSDYQNDAHAQDFKIQMSLSLAGIGASLMEDDGYCTITKLIPGGPAYKSEKLFEKDRIIAVAQGTNAPVDVVDMDLSKVVQLIRGPIGTEVRLTISRADDGAVRRTLPPLSLRRDEIKLEDSEAKAVLIETPDAHGGTNRIGVINVPSFYAPIDSNAHSYISKDTAKLIEKLKKEKVNGIVLDLRNNPGGSLEEAVKFTGLFITDGPIVQARNSHGEVTVENDTDSSVLYDGPLAVMINRFSASAAEIAAAALQDYGRAIIVGDTSTHGKGTVQNLNQLKQLPPSLAAWPQPVSDANDPGTLKITIRKFYRVNGESTQLKGVVPDIILPDTLNYLDNIGEVSLENPLAYDTNAPVNYSKLNLIAPHLAALRQNSDARIATNQDFIYINQDIELVKKAQADKTVTINEQALLKERKKNTDQKNARDAERAMRPLPNEMIFTNTVEDAGLSGLPAPLSLTATNENVLLIATNENGSVRMMNAKNEIFTGILLSRSTNTPAGHLRFGDVITKTQSVDPMLDETINILQDYISLSSTPRTLIAQ